MTLGISILITVCVFIAAVAIMLIVDSLTDGRDTAARDRDYALAKLYEARAGLMRVEEMERRDAIRRIDDVERAQRRDAACEEARQS